MPLSHPCVDHVRLETPRSTRACRSANVAFDPRPPAHSSTTEPPTADPSPGPRTRPGNPVPHPGSGHARVREPARSSGRTHLQVPPEAWPVTTPPGALHAVRGALEAAGFAVESATLGMVPTTMVPLADTEGARRVLRLLDALDDHDDVQGVYSNFDIPDSILASVEI